jgi:hypothetical protein
MMSWRDRDKTAVTEAESASVPERIPEEGLPISQKAAGQYHDDLDHLAGTWSDEEAAEFDAALAEQRKIEPELWKEQRAGE